MITKLQQKGNQNLIGKDNPEGKLLMFNETFALTLKMKTMNKMHSKFSNQNLSYSE